MKRIGRIIMLATDNIASTPQITEVQEINVVKMAHHESNVVTNHYVANDPVLKLIFPLNYE